MKELGIGNPDDLPPEFWTKARNSKIAESEAPKPPQIPVALELAGAGSESHTPPGLPYGYAPPASRPPN